MLFAKITLVLILSFLSVGITSFKFNLDPQGACKLEDNSEGICVPIKDCSSALNDPKNKKKPQICSFDNLNPIVCCEKTTSIIEVESKSVIKCREFYYQPPINDGKVQAVGGVNSLSQEFPHMAALGFGNEDDITWACGGSLISEKFVLTAAHCLISRELGEVRFVRLGDLDLKSIIDNALPQDFKVAARIKHPDYRPPAQYNDIALIELDKPAIITWYVKPACLQPKREIPLGFWIATGWGTLSFGGQQATHLQKVFLKNYDDGVCKNTYPSSRRLTRGIDFDMHICAGAETMDTCQGDSGGPLQILNTHLNLLGQTIIGVTSFGKACGISKGPSVYTRVSHYIDWIESIVWPN